MAKVNMDEIVKSINSKNVKEVPKESVDTAPLEAITQDDNESKTPVDNANDIDTIAITLLMMEKILENVANRIVEIERQHAVLVEMVQGGQAEPVMEAPVEEVAEVK